MSTLTSATTGAIRSAIERDGYVFVHGAGMGELLAPHGGLADWAAFADSWNHLELDTYMADGGRYRRRRHGTYRIEPGGPIVRAAHQPHFQAIDYNPLNGGVARWFEAIDPSVGDGPSMHAILDFCRGLFESLEVRLKPDPTTADVESGFSRTVSAWHVEVHQFRIEARPNERGRPTPEGLHRDGVDYVLVLLIDRRNIASGVTSINALDGTHLGHFTLTEPCDAALVDDTRVAHGVTPVEPIDPALPAYRDVLVVTFKAGRAGEAG